MAWLTPRRSFGGNRDEKKRHQKVVPAFAFKVETQCVTALVFQEAVRERRALFCRFFEICRSVWGRQHGEIRKNTAPVVRCAKAMYILHYERARPSNTSTHFTSTRTSQYFNLRIEQKAHPGSGSNSTRGRDSKLKKLRTNGCRQVVQASPHGNGVAWRPLPPPRENDDDAACDADPRPLDPAVNGLRRGLLAPHRKHAANNSGLSRTGLAWSIGWRHWLAPFMRGF